MHPYFTEQMTRQHVRELAGQASWRRPAGRGRASRGRARSGPGHGLRLRRQAGWALVSLGLRLAYATGED